MNMNNTEVTRRHHSTQNLQSALTVALKRSASGREKKQQPGKIRSGQKVVIREGLGTGRGKKGVGVDLLLQQLTPRENDDELAGRCHFIDRYVCMRYTTQMTSLLRLKINRREADQVGLYPNPGEACLADQVSLFGPSLGGGHQMGEACEASDLFEKVMGQKYQDQRDGEGSMLGHNHQEGHKSSLETSSSSSRVKEATLKADKSSSPAIVGASSLVSALFNISSMSHCWERAIKALEGEAPVLKVLCKDIQHANHLREDENPVSCLSQSH
ncbi:hypothetical protein E2C01_009912 [Portunus trituberculatus]|uniref:Uncharacterized protein n=1 Tax=Portunus trituberculatus TaxID=210409 RepID=A0A5B7D793_PORTR|nr:hypothetical protein [Portunus trituberculatus]